MSGKMTQKEEEAYVSAAFRALVEKGIAKPEQLCPSHVTDEAINQFESAFDIKIPSLYRAFLKAYRLDCKYGKLMRAVPLDIDEETINDEEEELRLLWLELILASEGENPLEKLYHRMEAFREMVSDDIIGMTPKSCKYLLPIGNWGAGWGPLCLDVSIPEEEADPEDGDTWTICWFDHEEFDWEERYLCGDGIVRGESIIPDFKTLLDWYFFGHYDKAYEEQEGEAPDYSRFME